MQKPDLWPGADLWRTDGRRYGRIDVRLAPGGGLMVRRREIGAGDLAAWGEDEHEADLELSPDAVARLALALLQDRYVGQGDALEALRDYCEARDIPARHSVWS